MLDTQELPINVITSSNKDELITPQAPERSASNPRRIDEQNDIFKTYFGSRSEGYSVQRITFSNLISANRNGVFLYESDLSQPNDSLHHAVWLQNSANISFLYPISQNEWREMEQRPDVIDKTTQLIMECFVEAQRFYPWDQHVDGISLEGKAPFGMEGGNVLGIRVSSADWEPLMLAVKNNDTNSIERLKKHLGASFAHERTHLERDDGLVSTVTTEIASHIAQYAFDPKDNTTFLGQLDRSLQNIEQRVNTSTQHQSLSLYDQASYAALVVIADSLNEHSNVLQLALKAEQDSHKIPFLKQISSLMSESDVVYLCEKVLPTIMKTDGKTLLEQAKQIEKKWGAVESIFTQ